MPMIRMPAIARTSAPATATRFGLWTREPAPLSVLHMPGLRDSVLVLDKAKKKRADQIVAFLKDAPKDTREAVVDSRDDSRSDMISKWVLSNGRVDSYDSTLKYDGWELTDFRRNPTVLYVHDSRSDRYLPIGEDVGAYISDERKALMGITRYVSEEVAGRDSAEARVIRWIAADLLRAVSVGFEPIEWQASEDRDDGESWWVPIDFLRQALREYSVCPVPANPDTLKDGRSFAGLAADDVEAFRDDIERALDGAGWLSLPRDQLELIRAGIPGTRAVVLVRNGDVTEEFAVIRADDIVDDEEDPESMPGDDVIDDADAKQLKCPGCGLVGDAASFGAEPKDGSETEYAAAAADPTATLDG